MLKPRDNKDSFYTFDDENKEIVFHRHDMPSPWMNYLTNETFFTMISQAGGILAGINPQRFGVLAVMASF